MLPRTSVRGEAQAEDEWDVQPAKVHPLQRCYFDGTMEVPVRNTVVQMCPTRATEFTACSPLKDEGAFEKEVM